MVNFGPLAAEIVSLVWGTPAHFNGFGVLAALMHGILVVGVSPTLRRWTEGATYIRQGDHHVGHWPTFLVCISSIAFVLHLFLYYLLLTLNSPTTMNSLYYYHADVSITNCSLGHSAQAAHDHGSSRHLCPTGSVIEFPPTNYPINVCTICNSPTMTADKAETVSRYGFYVSVLAAVSTLVMVALCNRADHYIFALLFLSIYLSIFYLSFFLA